MKGPYMYYDEWHDVEAAKEEVREFCCRTYELLREFGVITRSVDSLNGTDDMDCIYERVRSRYPISKREAGDFLMNSRKGGRCKAPE